PRPPRDQPRKDRGVMPVVVVVGAQWGDEGKGKVVDLLTEKAQVVARWGGGANAGHTIVVDGKKHVTHLMPSGVLRKDVTGVRGEDLLRPDRFRRNLQRNVASLAPTLRELGAPVPDVEAIAREYLALGEEIRPFVGDASRFLYDSIRQRKNVLLEGAQGVLL